MFIPKWLNVVKGVVDSEDLLLNVYRETLQQNKILRVIKKNHVKKCSDMSSEIAESNDDHKKFCEQFVECMKFGIRQNSVDDFEIVELLRFNTNTSKFGDRRRGRMAIVTSPARVRVMRYFTWLTLWMNTPCTGSKSSSGRSRNRQRRRDWILVIKMRRKRLRS